MEIKLNHYVTTLFQFAEPSDFIRPHPTGKIYVVTKPITLDDGRKVNAVCTTSGELTFFAPDEKIDVFVKVKFLTEI